MAFDLELYAELSSASREAARAAREKAISVVIGNTKAGKSTTIDILSGCYPEVGEDEAFRFAAAVPAIVGANKFQSETIYPGIISQSYKGEDLHLCDSPGFNDSRTTEYKVAACRVTGSHY